VRCPLQFLRAWHSGAFYETNVPESANNLKNLDSHFHGNDERTEIQTFYGIVKSDDSAKSMKLGNCERNKAILQPANPTRRSEADASKPLRDFLPGRAGKN
jgi:hypothetical protein